MCKRFFILIAFLCAAALITWGQIVVPSNGGIYPPTPGGLSPVMQATVVDVYGRTVGTTSAFLMGPAFVLVQVNGRLMSVQVVRSAIMSSGAGLYSLTPDCSGTLYTTPDPTDALILPAVFGPPGRTLFVPRPGAVPQVVTPVAQLILPNNGPPACIPMMPPQPGAPLLQFSLVPADKSVDFSQFFTPPFSIRTQ